MLYKPSIIKQIPGRHLETTIETLEKGVKYI